MKVVPIQIANNPFCATQNNLRSEVGTPKNINTKQDCVSFTGAAEETFRKIIDKFNKKITYTNADKLIKEIDNVLGDNYFSGALEKAHISASKDNTLVLDKRTFGGDLLKTVKYPIVGLPLDIANNFLTLIAKGPLQKPAESLLGTKLLKTRAENAQIEKNYNIARDIMEQFAEKEGTYNINETSKEFMDSVTSSIIKTTANYNSRDERTLNRAGTLTVSAAFSALDFFHISMLQKNDEKEAKKAQNYRLKQELSRMGLSAAMTYLTMGAFDRYTKDSVGKNALVIAISALISEVGSRLFSGTSLHPLTPEEAAKYAQGKKDNHISDKNEAKNLQNDKKDIEIKDNKENTTSRPETPAFNGTENKQQILQSHSQQMNNIFSQFKKEDGNFAILENLSQPEEVIPKKKHGFKDYMLLATGISSLAYFLKKGVSGEYSMKLEQKKLYENFADEIEEFINNPSNKMSARLSSAVENIKDMAEARAQRTKSLKETLTEKKVRVSLFDVRSCIEGLKTMPEAKSVENIIDEYIKHIDAMIYNEGVTFKLAKVERPIVSGFYDGVTKIFKTVYTILSAPAALADSAIDKIFFSKTSNVYKAVNKKITNMSAQKYKKEIDELIRITHKDISLKDPKKIDEANRVLLNTIIRDSRNFEKSPETGELANFSRTLVTAISTYFFVNDYTNKVLIESGGKDVDKAREERNQRIAHKFSNFIINGTLMNLFNSIFKKQLNDSLWKATAIAMATEVTNETLVRKSICQPVKKLHSKQEIVDYENKQTQRKGIMGLWTRMFRKITGKKTLVEKAEAQPA